MVVKYIQAIKCALSSDNPSALFQKILRLLAKTALQYDILSRAITCAQKAAKTCNHHRQAARPHLPARLAGLAGEKAEPVKRAAPIAGDILYGAEEIAEFLFGNRKFRRRVYNLVERNGLPIFRIGTSICARKSTLQRWVAEQKHKCAEIV
jgi:hypothetical protein